MVDTGLIDMELIMRANHNHLKYRVEKEKFYFKLEEATCGTSYAALLKLSQHRKDGRGAFSLSPINMPVTISGMWRL